MIHFKERLLPNCALHNLQIVTVNGGESTSQYHTLLADAKFTGKRKKIKSSYFKAIPCIVLRGHWCNIIALNVHAPSEEKSDD